MDDFMEFKVIKKIALTDDSVSETKSSSKANNSKIGKLDKIEVTLTPQISKEIPSEYKGVKKIDLRIDTADVLKTTSINEADKKPIFQKKNNKKKSLITSENTDNLSSLKFKEENKFSKEENIKYLPKNATIYLEDSTFKDTANSRKLKNSSKKEILVVDKIIKKNISFDDNLNSALVLNNLKNMLTEVSSPFKEDAEIKSPKEVFYNSLDEKENDVNFLLEELNKKTDKLNEDVFLEIFSFVGNTPKKEKVNFSSYDIKNLYAKIDHLNSISEEKDAPSKEFSTHKKNDLPLKESTSKPSVQSSSSVFKKTSSYNLDFPSKRKDQKFSLLEEIDVPDIFAIKDDSTDLESIVDSNFLSQVNLQSDITKELNDDSNLVSIIKTNEGSEKIPNLVLDDNNKVKLNEEVFKNINRLHTPKKESFNIDSFDEKMTAQQNNTKEVFSKINFTSQDDERLQLGLKQIIKTPQVIEKTIVKKIKENPRVKKDLMAEKFKELRDKGIDYILPKDAGKNIIKINKEVYQEELSSDNSLFSSFVYNDPILNFEKDITKIFDKYSIDEFTYVTIYYDQEVGLFYNIIQPELNVDQEKEYQQLKRIFFNTIDQNYYSFNGDKRSLDRYIEKIYDLSLDKLSYNIANLQKKLYLKFIQREFFGLGILTNLLQDKKIIEVSCSGEKSNLTVLHVEYGVLKTNISFPDINELNRFVLILTKNMGLYITQAHPIIEGYLPNGYKVEGLYSIGDTSSKGSSFVIKKYLEEPLNPISLINTSIGSVDVFSYIWSAIEENYKIIIVDTDDSFIVFNSIMLFLPDKKIITVQAYDRFKLPQKDWINRVFTANQNINKNIMIEQTISQKPDFVIVDEFSTDVFDVSWYNINMFSITPDVSTRFIEQLKSVNQKAIIIELKKIKQGIKEVVQIINVKEIINKKETPIIYIDTSQEEYTINLLSSSINIPDFLKRKKLIKWMRDAKIYDYKDFYNIVSQYNLEKENLFKKLDIK